MKKLNEIELPISMEFEDESEIEKHKEKQKFFGDFPISFLLDLKYFAGKEFIFTFEPIPFKKTYITYRKDSNIKIELSRLEEVFVKVKPATVEGHSRFFELTSIHNIKKYIIDILKNVYKLNVDSSTHKIVINPIEK